MRNIQKVVTGNVAYSAQFAHAAQVVTEVKIITGNVGPQRLLEYANLAVYVDDTECAPVPLDKL